VRSETPSSIPPARLIQQYFGTSDAGQYITLGDNLLVYLVEHAGLRPNDSILDVGCGIGLAARPLIQFLGPEGRYEGFDVVKEAIDWCRTEYRQLPTFRFQHADIYNKHYNPRAKTRPREYIFPYADGEFDMVLLASVFTHLLPDDVKHYLREVARVMKRGGQCFISYFLLNPESLAAIQHWMKDHPAETEGAVPGGLAFRWQYSDCCRVYDWEVPETAVAYDEAWVSRLYAEHGLTINSIVYGEWCRRSLQPGWQDTILAEKA
jgi:SAM-dependent methyltransferase